MDNHTPEQRHYNMSRIKAKNTVPEKILMKALRDKGIWFTHHRKDVFGHPDIVFKRKKVAVFVDSAFWHGNRSLPKTNCEFWTKKLDRNIQRDFAVNNELAEKGWTVIRISDDDVKNKIDECIEKILDAINNEAVSK